MTELITRNKHPALKAIIPTHCFYDTYIENVFPGGVYDYGFGYNWETMCRGLDQNDNSVLKKLSLLSWVLVKGIKRVSADTNGEKLKEAILQHRKNVYAHELISNNQFRDDSISGGISYKDISIFTHQKAIEEAGVNYLNIASWFDSGYGDAVIKRFMNMKTSGIYVLGDWNHGYRVAANPYYPKRKQIIPTMNTKEATSAFIHYLADFLDIALSNQIEGKSLYYYTLGEEKWKKTSQWPPEGQTLERWYLNENNSLTQVKPNVDESAKDTYDVDFNATTGNRNRWWTLLSFPIDYSRRTEQDKLCLIYTSSLLQEEKEITGHAIITLYLTSTHEDGAIFAYLEDVDEQGNVVYLSEGQLRLIHHRISTEEPPFKINTPYHTYHKKDVQPLTPGQITEVTFGLLPVSALIKKGHRIRISLAGHDKDTFQRYPAEGDPTLEISRNPAHPSFVDIPVII